MRITLTIEGDDLIVRLWQDGPAETDGEDGSVLISQAYMGLDKLRKRINVKKA